MKLGLFSEIYMVNYWIYDIPKKEIAKIYPEQDFTDSSAKCFISKDNELTAIVIWYDKNIQKKTSILEHEILHAVSNTFILKGIYFDLENDEPAAYLYQWLHTKIRNKDEYKYNETYGNL